MPDPNQTTPPRAPVFRCPRCEAVWRTEQQRDLCCTAKPETVPQPTEPDNGVLLLLNEAISLGRRDGMAGQHLGAMCSARDEIERLRAALTAVNEACRKYEEGGFGDPGRAMDDVRGALGRRDGA